MDLKEQSRINLSFQFPQQDEYLIRYEGWNLIIKGSF